MSAFNERGIDQEFGRPQKQPGALGNVPGFFSDIARRFSPTTPFSGAGPGTGSPDPMASLSRAFNSQPSGGAAFGGNDRFFQKTLDGFRPGPGESN